MNTIARACHFPQISNEPIPFYKHPYKLFAVNPLTYIFWQTLQLCDTKEALGDQAYVAAVGLSAAASFCVNGGSVIAMDEYYYGSRHHSRLTTAVIAVVSFQIFNLLDIGGDGSAADILLGKDVLIFRIALIASTFFVMATLIPYANKDRPYQDYLLEDLNAQAELGVNWNKDEIIEAP